MKRIFMLMLMVLGIAVFVSAQEKTTINPADTKTLAEKIVNQCAMVKPGDMVWIEGNPSQIDLLQEISLNVQKKGGNAILTVNTPELNYQVLKEVPEKYDQTAFDMQKKILGIVNVIIDLEDGSDPSMFADIPPQRMAARNKAGSSVGDLMVQRNIKYVNLGNGMYPSEYKAKELGMTQDELSKIFWKGVNTDYNTLEANGKGVSDILKAGKTLKITNPNGTNFSVQIEKRPVFVQDGSISEDDMKMGIAAREVYLPAGEVMLAPVPGTAEGRIVVNRQMYMGKEIDGLTLDFKKGKLVSMTAKSGLEPLKARYDAAGAGKDEFAFLDLGINPDVKVAPDSKFVAWVPAGMVTVGTGANYFIGGDNKSDLSLSFFLPGSTVTVDDNAIVDKGELKIKRMAE